MKRVKSFKELRIGDVFAADGVRGICTGQADDGTVLKSLDKRPIIYRFFGTLLAYLKLLPREEWMEIPSYPEIILILGHACEEGV